MLEVHNWHTGTLVCTFPNQQAFTYWLGEMNKKRRDWNMDAMENHIYTRSL